MVFTCSLCILTLLLLDYGHVSFFNIFFLLRIFTTTRKHNRRTKKENDNDNNNNNNNNNNNKGSTNFPHQRKVPLQHLGRRSSRQQSRDRSRQLFFAKISNLKVAGILHSAHFSVSANYLKDSYLK